MLAWLKSLPWSLLLKILITYLVVVVLFVIAWSRLHAYDRLLDGEDES